jgi:thioredoxin-related protein
MKIKPMIGMGVMLVTLNCSGFALAGDEAWSSDFAAAKKEAAESKKDLLIDFTGSDWCGWCIKLNEEVFSQDFFKAGVKDKFVLVEIDYPNDKSKLSAETIKQNDELRIAYPVRGFPTILLADADGKPFAATGYQEGGPEAYVKHLDELRAKKAVRDQSFATASKATGVEKAKALVAALGAMDLADSMISKFYGDVAEQIKTADPKDETGFTKEAATKARLAKFQNEVQACAQKDDHDGALTLVNTTLKEGGFNTEDTQQIMITRTMILNHQKKFDEALKALDEVRAFAPDSEIAGRLDAIKTRIEEGKKEAAESK